MRAAARGASSAARGGRRSDTSYRRNRSRRHSSLHRFGGLRPPGPLRRPRAFPSEEPAALPGMGGSGRGGRAAGEGRTGGCSAAYFLVHAIGRKRTYPRREAPEVAASREAAAQARVGRILYLGGVAARNPASRHLQSWLRTGEILRSGSAPTVELRAATITGSGVSIPKPRPRGREFLEIRPIREEREHGRKRCRNLLPSPQIVLGQVTDLPLRRSGDEWSPSLHRGSRAYRRRPTPAFELADPSRSRRSHPPEWERQPTHNTSGRATLGRGILSSLTAPDILPGSPRARACAVRYPSSCSARSRKSASRVPAGGHTVRGPKRSRSKNSDRGRRARTRC